MHSEDDVKEYFENYKDTILKVEDLLKSLTDKEYGVLTSLIRSNNFILKSSLKNMMISYSTRQKNERKKLDDSIKVYLLYDKANVSVIDLQYHWTYNNLDQHVKHKHMNTMTKPPRQDNKTYINCGSGHDNYNSIRYPSKKRKTAWKRFYKLFPHLKKEENKDI
jgi:hypothetical protein